MPLFASFIVTAPHAHCPAWGCDILSKHAAHKLARSLGMQAAERPVKLFSATIRRSTCDLNRARCRDDQSGWRESIRRSASILPKPLAVIDVHSYERTTLKWAHYDVVILHDFYAGNVHMADDLYRHLRSTMRSRVGFQKGSSNDIQDEFNLEFSSTAATLLEFNDALGSPANSARFNTIINEISIFFTTYSINFT